MATLFVYDIGRAPYAPTVELQRRFVAMQKSDIEAGEPERGFLVLVEHDPPAITLGRGGGAEHVLASRDELARLGIEVHESDRGGDVTYHGPGQVVAYPILRVDLHGKDVHGYLRDIEEVVLRVLDDFGIEGHRKEGLTGVWVGEAKVAAAGIALSQWISRHGLALNVSPNLSHFKTIVPCGIKDRPVTSLSALLDREVDVGEAKPLLIERVVDVFGFDEVELEKELPCDAAM